MFFHELHLKSIQAQDILSSCTYLTLVLFIMFIDLFFPFQEVMYVFSQCCQHVWFVRSRYHLLKHMYLFQCAAKAGLGRPTIV